MSIPDVIVVGAGPAGSTLGGLLARRGWTVQVLDRATFPRPKPCGECLNPGGVAALERLGLAEAVAKLDPVPLLGWDIHTTGGHRARGSFGHRVGHGLGISRSRLDHALVREARARGASVEEGVRVTSIQRSGGSRPPSVHTRAADGAESVRSARVVVGADGLRSVVARELGAIGRRPRLRKLSLTFRMRGSGPHPDRGRLVLGDGETVGLAPVGTDGRARLWNATLVVDADREGRRVAGDAVGYFRRRLAALVRDWEGEPEILDGPWASGPFDWPTRRVSAPGFVLVGDAAGYYDPLTGEGMFRALRSAELAADVIDRALHEGGVCVGDLSSYQSSVRTEFAPQRRVQHLIEAVVRRPLPREWVIGRLGSREKAMDALVRVTGDARPVRSLVRPGTLWALLSPRSSASAEHSH